MTPPAGLAGIIPARIGNYDVVCLLARGGMADIYLAHRRDDNRVVALKVLDGRCASDEACMMFVHEARLCRLLSHENVAAAYELSNINGIYALAMEYVDGIDLRHLMNRVAAGTARVSLPCALSIVAAAAAGLDHAHRHVGPDGRKLAVVHRDVSLSNIMVGRNGAVKVIDFGIATSATIGPHTTPGTVRGKSSYMAPEQCVGDPVDPRSDVFSLGVVLYELTTGQRCFSGKSDSERMNAVLCGEWKSPTKIVADFPATLEHVIRTALSLDPAHRYPTAAAMIEALEMVALLEGWIVGPHHTAALARDLFATHASSANVLDGHNTTSDTRLDRDVEDEIDRLVDDQLDRIVDEAIAMLVGARDAVSEPSTIPTDTPTRAMPRRRLARGSQPNLHSNGADVDGAADPIDDIPTRGRRALPRLVRLSLPPSAAA